MPFVLILAVCVQKSTFDRNRFTTLYIYLLESKGIFKVSKHTIRTRLPHISKVFQVQRKLIKY